MKSFKLLMSALLCFVLFACDDDQAQGTVGGMTAGTEAGMTAGTTGGALESNQYFFQSRFDQQETVSINGQALRLLLIRDLGEYIVESGDQVDAGELIPEAGKIVENLKFYYEFNEAGKDIPMKLKLKETDPPILQKTYGELAVKNLKDKLAGNDTTTQYRDWNTLGLLGLDQSISPEAFLLGLFDEFEAHLINRAQGQVAQDPLNQAITSPIVSSKGIHYEELIQKFLTGAIPFSQATDDYLDDAQMGEGILVDNTMAEEGENWTALEHHWDEAFGYFGHARAYQTVGYIDLNGDQKIDLLTEYQAGLARYARSRDEAGQSTFSLDIFNAFLAGRQLISENQSLNEAQLTELKGYRDSIISSWEKVIAASVLHYLNDCLEKLEMTEVNFSDFAKDWSELKGLALAFQFNPKSSISAEKFQELHTKIGLNGPIWSASHQWGDLKVNLEDVRTELANIFGWTAAEASVW